MQHRRSLLHEHASCLRRNGKLVRVTSRSFVERTGLYVPYYAVVLDDG
jgi:hypothetical protein